MNYIIQIACIPVAIKYEPDLSAMLSMVNPSSVCWVLEMFGYAFLGISIWFLEPIFKENGRQFYIRVLIIVNGLLSIAGAVITVLDISWVLSPIGLITYVGWNLLVVILMVLFFLEYRIQGDRE
jgi:hypothetical protein